MKYFFSLMLVLSVAARAETPAPAPTDPARPERPRVLVLDPSSQVFDPATISTITGLLIVELSQEPRLDIISATEVKKLAELEGDKQAAGCVDSSCLAELAGAMGARYVVFGDVGKLGDTVVMSLNLFDSKTTLAVQRITVQATDGIGGLPVALRGKLAPLVEPLFAVAVAQGAEGVDGASGDDGDRDGDNVASLPKKGPPGEGPGVFPWVLIGGGAAVILGGTAFDVISPTSKNGAEDSLDYMNPAAIVVGSAVAVFGVVMLLTSGGGEDSP